MRFLRLILLSERGNRLQGIFAICVSIVTPVLTVAVVNLVIARIAAVNFNPYLVWVCVPLIILLIIGPRASTPICGVNLDSAVREKLAEDKIASIDYTDWMRLGGTPVHDPINRNTSNLTSRGSDCCQS